VVRVAVTADLHHDVARSREPAEALAESWRRGDVQADALLLIGDTATSDGDALEQALHLFPPDGRPRLFVPGNHELWSKRDRTPAEVLLASELPRRVRRCGWHWLPGDPFGFEDATAVVGTGGWYDFAYAEPRLGLDRRFYTAHASPAALRDLAGVPAHASGFYARWNDARFAHEVGDAEAFTRQRLADWEQDLRRVASARAVLAAVHVVPTPDLLPIVPAGPMPDDKLKYAFARAYLGSPTFGQAAMARPNVTVLACGHSHHRRRVERDGRLLLNVGCTYTEKRFDVLDLKPPR
jgi:hypothetical protein